MIELFWSSHVILYLTISLNRTTLEKYNRRSLEADLGS